ncbi:hypothetical protein C0J52_28277 [Blattella germanica]|nr:hypothetical protein C0J52_28277 [Blattella germanica]
MYQYENLKCWLIMLVGCLYCIFMLHIFTYSYVLCQLFNRMHRIKKIQFKIAFYVQHFKREISQYTNGIYFQLFA